MARSLGPVGDAEAADEAPRPTAIYVLIIEEPGRWYRRKTYWPLLNGQPPKSLLDEEALWGQAAGVTVTRYHFELIPVEVVRQSCC